jgi:hypothetical protein
MFLAARVLFFNAPIHIAFGRVQRVVENVVGFSLGMFRLSPSADPRTMRALANHEEKPQRRTDRRSLEDRQQGDGQALAAVDYP